jgi:CrcB protein
LSWQWNLPSRPAGKPPDHPADDAYREAAQQQIIMNLYLWIALGSALGGMARHGLNGFVTGRMGEVFPWGTLLINIIGSFAIGLFYTATGPDGRWVVGQAGRLFFVAGICGGFTTFSAFSLQSLILARNSEWLRAGAYVGGSVVFCLFAVWLGHVVATFLNPARPA